MSASSRKLLLKLSFVVAMVVFLLSFQPKQADAFCTYGGYLASNCSRSCYDQVYCEAIECFHQSWAQGGNGEECCFYNTYARFCGSGCPLFCATP
jgi:hypothetical protein